VILCHNIRKSDPKFEIRDEITVESLYSHMLEDTRQFIRLNFFFFLIPYRVFEILTIVFKQIIKILSYQYLLLLFLFFF
jgi:hypothetical protein